MLMEQPVFCTTLFVPTDMECQLSVLMPLHQLCSLLSVNFTTVFQPGDTSAVLRILILDDSLGVEGTDDFTATLSVFSSVSVTPGNTYIATVSIDETIVEFTPVNYIFNERERVVVLNISASDLGALNYSVEVDVLPGTAQGWCIVQVV